ncbi:TerD family protein [Pseudomonas amygdali]|uniref:Stress protein n=2 Tax=Pseudomonas amygdali pv. lachrymans TaxID=53707 RepID=A0ABR5KSB8_PSEAV|nr:TerD family protein [Pseudomonas amygdali]AXH60298.1 TerD family protein [Pseudomonas amygdali pv. lachrymans str. M301315]KPC17688.1 Stress protein [Pseudomonas amygdali pv. lachrymans]RMT05964.1 Stress protein [Pseudomonas amygdali pv. lachrymans]
MIQLKKGSRISLAKPDGSALRAVSMGLGWDGARGIFGGAKSVDLDASVLLLDANKALVDQVWFRQLHSRCGSISHSGDNRTGAGDGDDETIKVNLAALPANVQYLVFTVNSYSGQSFNDVENAYCNLYDESGTKVAQFNLSEKGRHTGLIMACIYRKDDAWKVNALGIQSSGNVAQDMINIIRDSI